MMMRTPDDILTESIVYAVRQVGKDVEEIMPELSLEQMAQVRDQVRELGYFVDGLYDKAKSEVLNNDEAKRAMAEEAERVEVMRAEEDELEMGRGWPQ